jgi:tight adherence protein C
MTSSAIPWIVLIAALMGAASGCAGWLITHAVLAGNTGSASRRTGLPAWLRLSVPLAAAAAPAIGAVIRPRWLSAARQQLRRCELEEAIEPCEWIVLPALTCAACGILAWTAGAGVATSLAASLAGASWPALWLRDRRLKLMRGIDRELPRFLELLTLAVEAGCALGAALRIGVEAANESSLRRGLAEALRAIHAGRPRGEALTELAARYEHPGLQAMLAAIVHADASGAGVATSLRAQAVQRTEERFARAERLAMESPVKMLAPLILCIFPCAFLVIGFPIAHRLMQWT